MIHVNTFNTFRLLEWPGSQASHLMYFKPTHVKYDLSLILEHIADELNDTNKAFVTYTAFSLLNVYAHNAKLSYGFQHPPHLSVVSTVCPLTCTFTFTTTNQYEALKPSFKINRTPYSKIWGHTLNTGTSFLTINIPKKIMREAKLLTPNLNELFWLYMAIGAFSKSFAKRHKFYRKSDDLYLSKELDHVIALSKYYNKNMPYMFKNVPYDSWIYSRDMWDLAPNIFSRRSFNENVVEYYCRYLALDFYKKTNAPNVVELEKKAYKFVRSGVLDILSKDIKTSKYVETVNAMTNHFFIRDNVNVEQITEQILKGTL